MQILIPYLRDNQELQYHFIRFFPDVNFSNFNDIIIYNYIKRMTEVRATISNPKTWEFYCKYELPSLLKSTNIRCAELGSLSYNDDTQLSEATSIIYQGLYSIIFQSQVTSNDFLPVLAEWNSRRLQEESATYTEQLFQLIYNQANEKNKSEELIKLSNKIGDVAERYSYNKLSLFLSSLYNKDDDDDDEEDMMKVVLNLDHFNTFFSFLSNTINIIVGTPGTGKSRFALGAISYEAMQKGIGVRFDNLEQSSNIVRAMLTARHTATTSSVAIPDNLITTGLKEDKVRYELYKAAKASLFKSGQFGRFYMPKSDEEMLMVDNLSNSMIRFFENNPDIKVWIIDYLGLISTRNQYLKGSDIIQKAIEEIQKVKKAVKDLTIIVLTQFSKEGVDRANKGMPYQDGDLEGGQVTGKYADKIYRFTMNESEKLTGISMTAEMVKNRYGQLSKIRVKTNKAYSKFEFLADSVRGEKKQR